MNSAFDPDGPVRDFGVRFSGILTQYPDIPGIGEKYGNGLPFTHLIKSCVGSRPKPIEFLTVIEIAQSDQKLRDREKPAYWFRVVLTSCQSLFSAGTILLLLLS